MYKKYYFMSYIPVRDFFRNPEKAGFSLSPDGSHLAYLAPYADRLNIFVQPIDNATAEPRRVTAETDRSISEFTWADNYHILYLKDNGGDENYHIFRATIDNTETRDLTPFEGVRAQLINRLRDVKDEVLISLNQRNPQVFDVYRLNVASGTLQMVAENPGNIMGWLTDHHGAVRIALASDGVNHTLLYRATENDSFAPILQTTFRESLNPITFTANNQFIYASSNLGRDKMAIVLFDIANGKEIEPIFEHPEVDVEGLIYSDKHKIIDAVYYTTWKTELQPISARYSALYQYLSEQLNSDNNNIFIADTNEDETRFLVVVTGDCSRGTYYLYDSPTQQLRFLSDVSPWLRPEDLAPMQPIQYISRDGLTIHGYLSLPLGVEPKNLPVVVNPHGGPWVRDTWRFNPEVQFLTNRGYAVLQMNYRGSTGYGRKFWEASFKQWGLAMQDDITDGVRYLIEKGIADPKRVAIYGGSYGGYAALAGLTFTPEVYACGVDFVGVSNLFTFMQTIPPYWKPMLQMMYEMVGNPETDAEQMRATSPVFHADRIVAPLLVAQGAKDPRVNIAESDQMVEALRKRGVAVQYMVKENEGHGFQNQENKFEFYEALEAFLAKYLS